MAKKDARPRSPEDDIKTMKDAAKAVLPKIPKPKIPKPSMPKTKPPKFSRGAPLKSPMKSIPKRTGGR